MNREKKNMFIDESNVNELIYNDFMFIKQKKILVKKNLENKNGFVIFYAPWCKHCKKRAKMWEEIATQFKNKFFVTAVNVENIEADNDLLRLKYNVKLYPSVFYVTKNGILHKYDGVLEKDDIVCFIWDKI